MSEILAQIKEAIDKVRGCHITPMDALNMIDDALDNIGPCPAAMTTRTWLALCSCILVMGIILGWGIRTHVTHDRYMTSLAMQHEAAEHYYNSKLINMVTDNERNFKRGK